MRSDVRTAWGASVAIETLRLSKDELAKKYADKSWRSTFYEAQHLSIFLARSVLAPKYKIPDEIVSLIPLTTLRHSVFNKLVRKKEVPPKEARMLCLLKQVHREPLLDFDKLNIEAIRKFIDQQIRDRQLLYPFILGRDLYDRAGELFEEPRPNLSYDETISLLEPLPIGVFQSGPFLSGPFGLVRSHEDRRFAPTLSVPMYHCSDLTCSAVHMGRLTSDYSAPINEHHSTLVKVLDELGQDESDWGDFLEESQQFDGVEFDDRTGEPVMLALGDLLSDQELRLLARRSLDHTSGMLRRAASTLGMVGSSEDITQPLGRSQLLQLLLLLPNKVLIEQLDKAIVSEKPNVSGDDAVLSSTAQNLTIVVPRGEVRRLRTNATFEFGMFGLYPELSSLGFRVRSDSFSLGPMRLRRLAEALYNFNDEADLRELEWQLRAVDGENAQDRLNEYVRSASPHEVVRQLVLSRSSNQQAASLATGVTYDAARGDEEFARSVLWKLGFYPEISWDPSRQFWEHHDRLRRFVDTAGVGSRVDMMDFRARAINCFVALEGVLDEALAYSTWALTADHLKTERPFSYAPFADRIDAFSGLNEFAHANLSSGWDSFELGDRNTLEPLIQGFVVLAQRLEDLQQKGEKMLRRRDDYPRFARHTDLKQLSLKHTAAFLDLLPKSQSRIIESLTFVQETLSRASIPSVRNDFGHYRMSSPELTKVGSALDAMDAAIRRLEVDGLIALPYSLIDTAGDQWGRHIYTLRSVKGREVALARPSAHDWLGLPSLRGVQYVMPSAVFAGPNEMLRFRAIRDTQYNSYWSGYPRRRRRQGTISQPSIVQADPSV